MDIKTIRERRHLTQEELAEQSGLSVRTIQRIEAGQLPKGHTAKVLSQALGMDLNSLSAQKSPEGRINYALVKRINLSSALVCFIPLINIILPLILARYYRQFNHLTKHIITLQILWSIVSTLAFFIAGFLKLSFSLHRQTGLWVAMVFIILNLVMILANSASIDKNKALYFKFHFSFI